MLTDTKLLTLFEESMNNDFEKLSPNTIRRNLDYVKRFLDAHSNFSSIEITQAQIKKYMNDLKKLNGQKMNIDSKQQHLSAIKKYYNFLYYDDNPELVEMRYFKTKEGTLMLRQNPISGMGSINTTQTAKLEKNDPKIPLTEAMAQSFLETVKASLTNKMDIDKTLNLRDYAMFCLMLELGLRVSDVISLNKNNFDLYNLKFKSLNHKSKVIMQLSISPISAQAIDDYWQNRNDVNEIAFCSKSGKRMLTKDINKNINKYAKKAGIINAYQEIAGSNATITCHILRHTCGALLYQRTNDIELVKRLLYHASVQTTQRYIQSSVTSNKIEVETNNLICDLTKLSEQRKLMTV